MAIPRILLVLVLAALRPPAFAQARPGRLATSP